MHRLYTAAELRYLHLSTYVNDCKITWHSLDDLGCYIYMRGFGNGFHEGIVRFVTVQNPENILVSMVCVSRS
jgi:hypothetical protein